MSSNSSIEWTDATEICIEYRTIDGFPGYRVGSNGTVWTSWAYNGHQKRRLSSEWRKMKPQPDGDGYLGLNLFRNGKPYRRKVHLLVIIAFKGVRPEGMQACHEDGILSNCGVWNLRWDTPINNQRDRVKHGTHCRGTKSPVSKLNETSVLNIRQRLAAGVQKKILASEFGVAASTISAIAARKIWGWL